ncbi:hypothetical protein K9M59_00335 [Candidatus Gracilibacteria bacterium]|nr:hypothetical protein [Candidatus Gracilibacteria bacterium]MCF7819030.1 hypothetical protein [Candidatus Gracilibacteria bacterium]
MSQIYWYFSLTPQVLYFSQLPPREFGEYLALGESKAARGQALFIELIPFESDYFPFEEAEKLCQEHPDGRPKASLLVSQYGVLEHIPIGNLGNLYFTTKDGLVLEIPQSQKTPPESEGTCHLYQEMSPRAVEVVSSLQPLEFGQWLTSKENTRHFMPKLMFVELKLNGLQNDPDTPAENLPYSNVENLRACLRKLTVKNTLPGKLFNRDSSNMYILARTIKGGFYITEGIKFAFYSFPTEEELETKYHSWWRSASNATL